MTRFMEKMVKTPLMRVMGITLLMAEVIMTQSLVEQVMTQLSEEMGMTLLIPVEVKTTSQVVMEQIPSKLEVVMT